MPANQYKGKRIAVTVPQALYKKVEKVAHDLTRSESSTVVYLVELGLKTLENEKKDT